MSRRLREGALRALLLVPFIGAILYLHAAHGVTYYMFLFGSGAWGFAMALKGALFLLVLRRLSHEGGRLDRTALVSGAVSGLCDLGMALAAFAWLGACSFPELVAFGLGIATIEAFVVVSRGGPARGTDLGFAAADLPDALDALSGAARLAERDLMPIARAWSAALLHVGSRGLVYVSYATGGPLPFVLALAALTYTEGWTGYRRIHSGRLGDLGARRRAFLGQALVAVGVLVLFLWMWGRMAGETVPPAAGAILQADRARVGFAAALSDGIWRLDG